MLFLLNLIIPGSGTAVSSFLGQESCSKTQFSCGLMQTLLTPYIIGYVLSIYWGALIVMKAHDVDHEDVRKMLPNNQRSDSNDM